MRFTKTLTNQNCIKAKRSAENQIKKTFSLRVKSESVTSALIVQIAFCGNLLAAKKEKQNVKFIDFQRLETPLPAGILLANLDFPSEKKLLAAIFDAENRILKGI